MVARAVLESPEFLEREAHTKGDEEREDCRDEIVDPNDIGEKIQRGEVDRERTGTCDHKSRELRIPLNELRK